jgi:hypothetical protein
MYVCLNWKSFTNINVHVQQVSRESVIHYHLCMYVCMYVRTYIYVHTYLNLLCMYIYVQNVQITMTDEKWRSSEAGSYNKTLLGNWKSPT